MTMHEIQKKLRKANRKNYVLYLFCNFMGLLLITAYSAMMYSPTVRDILPEGGDSRKQLMAVFALTCVGCVVFTIYAASLFFRMKSREIGIFLALGASRKGLMPAVVQETVYLSGISALAGILGGVPFAALVWQMFRFFIVDSEEMSLRFDLRCLMISAAFWILVMGAAAFLGWHHLKNNNIMDVIHEEHKNEPVKELKPWCGPAGIVILLVGAVFGYYSGMIYMKLFSAYPPGWLNLTYVPVFVGLYMILLHTVVHGWRKKRHPYKKMISRSMMKFQGKQTVNNMLVVTVLIAGGCFGLFYIPITQVGANMLMHNRAYDYWYEYPQEAPAPERDLVEELAASHGLTVADWQNVPYITMALDGEAEITDEETGKFHYEYTPLYMAARMIPESTFESLTGQSVEMEPGTYRVVLSEEGTAVGVNESAEHMTNMTTRKMYPVENREALRASMLSGEHNYYVISDEDFQVQYGQAGDQWKGKISCFNIEGEDSYAFAHDLYDVFVDAMADGWLISQYPDAVERQVRLDEGLPEGKEEILVSEFSPDEKDTTEFHLYWEYGPQFRILDMHDSLTNFAVFFMMFLFIAIVCFLAAMIICYTRCMTIAINNRYVFEDLARLGASPTFLKKEIRGQAGSVFSVPSLVGMSMMLLLFFMILYANDNMLTVSELAGYGVCVLLMCGTGIIFYGIYRRTVKKMASMLIQR